MRFCDKLPKQRKNNNLSQEQLAEKLGVSRQAVSKWESGLSYPDMDKILQICTILNCTLEDLLDDGAIGNKNIVADSKISFNLYLQDLLKFATKTSNMFNSMNWKEKLKCCCEMMFIAIILFIIGSVVFLVINSITGDILSIIPFSIEYYFKRILESIYLLILFVLGIVIVIHLFKVRYLDYFITIEDSNVSKKTIEEPIEKNKHYHKVEKDKVIIRDPKHSSYSFLYIFGTFIFLIIKAFVFMLSIPVMFLFVLFTLLVVISIFHIMYGSIFIGTMVTCIGLVLMSFIVLYFAYNFVFNRPFMLKKVFILFISGLIILGIGLGLTITSILSYKHLKNYDDLEKYTRIENIAINENTYIRTPLYSNNVEYVIDNNLTDAKIEITCLKDIECNLNFNHEKIENMDYYYLYFVDYTFFDMYDILMKDLKDKKIRYYYNDEDLMKLTIYLSEDNYKILENNMPIY